LKDRPFALLGVHSNDYEPAKLKAVMEKEKLNWRSLSSRAVTEKWSARSTPAYYVLDARGVIRFKWMGYPGAKTMDAALEKLLREAEGKK
jgi:hypothetical protein